MIGTIKNANQSCLSLSIVLNIPQHVGSEFCLPRYRQADFPLLELQALLPVIKNTMELRRLSVCGCWAQCHQEHRGNDQTGAKSHACCYTMID